MEPGSHRSFCPSRDLSTLAAAYAELADFEKAIHWSEKAVETGSQEQQEALREELETYRAGKPFRERLSAPEPEEEKPEPEGQAETAEKPENHEQKPQKPPPPPKE